MSRLSKLGDLIEVATCGEYTIAEVDAPTIFDVYDCVDVHATAAAEADGGRLDIDKDRLRDLGSI